MSCMSTSYGILTVPRQNKFQMHNRRRQRQGDCSARFNDRELAFTLAGNSHVAFEDQPKRYGANRMQDYEAQVRKASQRFVQTGGSASMAGFSDTKAST